MTGGYELLVVSGRRHGHRMIVIILRPRSSRQRSIKRLACSCTLWRRSRCGAAAAARGREQVRPSWAAKNEGPERMSSIAGAKGKNGSRPKYFAAKQQQEEKKQISQQIPIGWSSRLNLRIAHGQERTRGRQKFFFSATETRTPVWNVRGSCDNHLHYGGRYRGMCHYKL